MLRGVSSTLKNKIEGCGDKLVHYWRFNTKFTTDQLIKFADEVETGLGKWYIEINIFYLFLSSKGVPRRGQCSPPRPVKWGPQSPQNSAFKLFKSLTEEWRVKNIGDISLLDFKEALRPSFILTFNCGFICEHLLFVQNKTKQKVHGFSNIFLRIFKIWLKLIFLF